MRRFNFSLLLCSIFVALGFFAACGLEKKPATPVETFQTYVKAYKKKDLTTMKLLLSSETIKMHEQEAKAEGVALDDIVKRETMLGNDQTTVEYRNEKIDGNKATLEYKDSGSWQILQFVREQSEWKIDKKSFADQLIRDVEQDSQQFDEMKDRGRQPF